MFTRSEQFIIQMKLGELRKQRTLLRAAYDKLNRSLATASSPVERLQGLYNGLRQISFAGQALHPDVANLEPLFYQFAAKENEPAGEKVTAPTTTGATPETTRFWIERLEKELASGRLRSEIVFIFAALLEEWAKDDPGRETDQESAAELSRLLERVTGPSPVASPSSQSNFGAPASPAADFDRRFVERLFASLPFDRPELKSTLRKSCAYQLSRRVEPRGLTEVLTKISRDRYHAPATRRQARSLLSDDLLRKEFADALGLILGELENWDWPREGVAARACLTPTKWRLFLDEDLPTACLLEIVGTRYQKLFREYFGYAHRQRFQELRKAVTELPPTTRVEQALRLHRQAFAIPPSAFSEIDIWSDEEASRVRETDLWEDPAAIKEKVKFNTSLEELLLQWASDKSILGKRAALKSEYRDLSQIDSYGQGPAQEEKLSTMETALQQINAEVCLAAAAFPGRPLYILKADLKDYYPGLSHALLLELLARFGLEQKELGFFERYLAVRVSNRPGGEERPEGQASRAEERETGPEETATLSIRRGVPNHRRLADLLGELVLLLLDYHLRRTARVQVIRMIDDICLIASSQEEALKAWQALEEFCRAFGLELNRAKCGAVRVMPSAQVPDNTTGREDGEPGTTKGASFSQSRLPLEGVEEDSSLPRVLPQQPPTWSMVTLNSRGEWSIDSDRFESYLEQSRQQVLKAGSLISQVEVYNNSLNYLVKALGMRLKLDASHRQSVRQAISRFHQDFFGPGEGMVEELGELIRERYLGAGQGKSVMGAAVREEERKAQTAIPDGWLYWPVTAGGLSLQHPLVIATAYAENFKKYKTPTPPDNSALPQDWQRRRNEWYHYYNQFLGKVSLQEPDPNQVMETLVQDFIRRGSEISLGNQHSLSTYWRWIVYLYGPQILERFGTFRFLLTELVPAQLITQRYRQGFSSGEEWSGASDDGTGFIELPAF
ncbi:MAG TPA: reverse transcriptase domain-containing protein [Chloroflexia bacterium]|nr:reverse transcriptase domain-containing protein [Chloroflexia bacterium]